MKIKASILYRLSKVCKHFELSTEEDVKNSLNVVRIEVKDNKSYAVATNTQIAVIEYLGETPEPDNVAHICVDDNLARVLEAEMLMDSVCEIQCIPAIVTGKLETSSGYTNSTCFKWFFDTPLNNWRGWVENPVYTAGDTMLWELYHVQTLFESSLSGKITFPAIYDNSKPLYLRDVENPNWLGVFIPSRELPYESAELPEWL